MSPVAERQMNCRKIQIDPSLGVIPATVDWLFQHHLVGTELNLIEMVIGLPSSRACRRLLEMLVLHAESKAIALTPPTITTIGRLPEHLYRQQKPPASELQQRLAWVESLNQLSTDQIRLIGPINTDELDWATRFSLGEMIAKLHRELAGNMYSFRDVLRIASELRGFRDHEQWQVLDDLQQIYFERLRNSDTWDIQTARRFAVDQNECNTDKQILLAGTVDLNRTIKQMLQQVADQVTVLVPSDEQTVNGFDELGCLKNEFWELFDVQIAKSHFRIGDRPIDQARIVVDFLGKVAKKYSAADISIAIPDSEMTPFVTRALRSAGVGARDSSGSSVLTGPAVRFAKLASKWISSQSFVDFAKLVRHEFVYARLTEKLGNDNWLEQLDSFYNRYCPLQIVVGPRSGEGPIDRLIDETSKLLEPIAGAGKKRLLSDWAVAWRTTLKNLFGGIRLNRKESENQRMLVSLSAINDGLVEFEKLDGSWNVSCPIDEALALLLSLAADRRLVANREASDIELMGWLDLTWDDAKVAVVTSFNEGKIPSSSQHHPFLPNLLRSHLGLLDNRTRYCRDKLALSLLLKNREHVLLVGGRRDAFENPLLPSRLLFTGDAEADAKRMLEIIHFSESRAVVSPDMKQKVPQAQQFEIPKPDKTKTLSEIWVTDFDNYRNCPYRYYLSKVLRLKSYDDRLEELGADKFGELAHQTLEAFGKSELSESTDPRKIEQFLMDDLDMRFKQKNWLGEYVLPAIRIQEEQLRMRLKMFAGRQAAWRRKGWRIIYSETSDFQREIIVDDQSVVIRGRIDRVDQQEKKNDLAIIDYKTGSPKFRKQFARRKNEWLSLQLPLYQWIFEASEIFRSNPDSKIVTGFARLGSVLDDIDFDLGTIKADQMELALQSAQEVIRNIRSENFEPNPSPRYSDQFDAICQNLVFERWMPNWGDAS